MNKRKRNRNIAIGLTLAGLGIWGLSRIKKQLPPVPEDVPTDPNYDEQLVNSVVADLTSTLLTRLADTSPRCTSLERYFNVPENEFKVIANKFKNQNGQAIRYAINNTWSDGCGVFATEWSDEVIKRLDALNVP